MVQCRGIETQRSKDAMRFWLAAAAAPRRTLLLLPLSIKKATYYAGKRSAVLAQCVTWAEVAEGRVCGGPCCGAARSEGSMRPAAAAGSDAPITADVGK